ncbi:hypothetical protein ABPG75_008300 [Micractinium tetrahymenae]
MARSAALAVCLLALATDAAAASGLSCTPGHLRLEFVAPQLSEDPIAKCLTSVQLDPDATCGVTLTALQSYGSHVPSLWSSDPDLLASSSLMVECPTDGKRVQAVAGSGTKLEAVRRAVIKALTSFVYGLNAYDQYNYEIEADVVAADMLQDDDITPIYEVPDCQALDHNNPTYSALALCKPNADADQACPANSYGVMVTEDNAVNAYNQKQKAFKVCAWCPSGTAGDGYGCTTCPAGQFSTIGGDCQDWP